MNNKFYINKTLTLIKILAGIILSLSGSSTGNPGRPLQSASKAQAAWYMKF